MRLNRWMIALLGAWTALAAQEADEMSASAGLASARVIRGVEYSTTAGQASWNWRRGGMQASLWGSQPWNSAQPGEWDGNVALEHPLGPSFSLAGSLTGRAFTRQGGEASASTFEAGLAGIFHVDSSLSLRASWDHDTRKRADFLGVALEGSQPLPSLGTFLEWRAALGFASGHLPMAGGRLADSYTYAEADLRLPWRFSGHVMITPGLHASHAAGQAPAWSPIGRSDGSRVWADLAVSLDF